MKASLFLLTFFSCFCYAYSQNSPERTDHHGNQQISMTRYDIIEPAPLSDGSHPWIPVGPFGGDVVDICFDPSDEDRILAAVGSPFISEDGGETWEILNSLATIFPGAVRSIEATSNGYMFAAGTSSFGKVYRSVDGGNAWFGRTLPVNSGGLCMAPDPGDTSTLYVGLQSNVSASVNNVIVKTTDGGQTWTACDMTNVLPIGFGVVGIAVDPDDGQTIIAVGNSGFSDAKIAASFDGGTTWEDRTGTLPTGIPYNDVAIAGHKVFVAGGQLFGSQYMGLYESSDYGLTWTDISGSFPNKVSYAIAIDPNDPDRMFVGTEGDGVYYSTDGGDTWNFDATGAGSSGSVRSLAINPEAPEEILAGFLSLAVCKSLDNGLTWEFANEGIATLQVDDIEVNPADPQMLLVGFEAENSGGCYLSQDGGIGWELIDGLPGTRFSQVTFSSEGVLYAWSNGPTTIAPEGLYKSTDGVTWTNTGPDIGSAFETQIFALAASEIDPGLLFIGGNNFGLNGWEPVIYRTNNAGSTWINTYLGSPDNFYSIRYIFIDPNSNDQIIYAAYKSEVAGGILKSEDGGFTWNECGQTIPVSYKWAGAVVCDPDNSNKLIAGIGGYGNPGTIVISEDAGASWNSTSLQMGNYCKITDLAVLPVDPQVIYMATSQEGARASFNGGFSWEAANVDLPASNITGFSRMVDANDTYSIYASTFSHSAWQTEIYHPGVGIEWDTPTKESCRIFPNPSSGSLFVDLTGKEDMIEQISVYSASGKKVYTWSSEKNGEYGSLLPIQLDAGMYLLHIRISNSYLVEKVVVY